MTSDPQSETLLNQKSEPTFTLWQGQIPLLISVPHSGSEIPSHISAQMTVAAEGSIDTDWFMEDLYLPIAKDLGASLISPRHSRYVIDLNRPESDESLYPGQTTTGLCPLHRFDGQPLYSQGNEPTLAEKHKRIETYWRPYHQALSAELLRLKTMNGSVLLWEGHSIKSVVPRLFDGQLPHLNIGTHQGQSCHPNIEAQITQYLSQNTKYSSVVNGRFKGGYITRYYGKPKQNIHAVQLELAQCTYLQDEQHPQWSAPYAQNLSQMIGDLLNIALSHLPK